MKYKNNPLNIRFSPSAKWQGLVGSLNGFCIFDTMSSCIRAALILLLVTYPRKYKCDTIYSAIWKWAPASDGNDPVAYIKFIADVVPFTSSRWSSALLSSDQCYVILNTRNVNNYTRLELYYILRAMCQIESNSELPEVIFNDAYNRFCEDYGRIS